MAIVFARPTLFSALSSRLIALRAGAPRTQSATIVRPFNPFGIYRPPFAPVVTLKPPAPKPEAMIAPPVSPVLIAAPAPAPAPAPVEVKGTCQTCKAEAAPVPAPAPAPAPEFALTSESAASEAPTPAAGETAPAPAAAAPRKVTGLLIAAGVILALLAFASYIRPRS